MPSIYQSPTPIPVTNGVFPQFKFALFGDNLSTVTSPGYLNSSNLESSFPLSNSDIIMALYEFSIQTNTGKFGIFTVNISSLNSSITLTEWINASEVVTPTLPNYLAHFVNSTGTISSAPGDVFQKGAISSVSPTVDKGTLELRSADNLGNTATTISNEPMNQASVITIPDPGLPTSKFVLSNINIPVDNLVIQSASPGIITDSGIDVDNVMQVNIENQMIGSGGIRLQKVDVTESPPGNLLNNGFAGQITTDSLTTAPNSGYVINWVNPKIAASSVISLNLQGGTNTSTDISFLCIPSAGTATLVIYNNSPAPFNGTIIIGYAIF